MIVKGLLGTSCLCMSRANLAALATFALLLVFLRIFSCLAFIRDNGRSVLEWCSRGDRGGGNKMSVQIHASAQGGGG